ncbi:MAG: aldehyde dehydrogenase family protein [Pseudomonadota bacterium]
MPVRCISPVDGSVYAERPTITLDATTGVIEKARQAQKAWAATALTDRTDLVMRGIQYLGEMNSEIVDELAWQMGRPVRYSGEFGGVQERASHMAAIAEQALEPITIEHSSAFERSIERIPHGLVFVVAPWNYPYLTAVNTIVPALIAGNAVLLKHASQTPLAGERFAQAFEQAGLPDGVFQNLFLDHETTAAMIGSGAFGFVNFTGSVSGGQSMERAAAGSFTNLGLELGGKDPGYVAEDANLEAAAATLIDGAMFNSGQCCCGIERIYVASSVYDEFVERSIELVNDYVLGNPFDPTSTLGPMAHVRFAELVREHINEAVQQGARALIDANKFADDGGAYLAPQILDQVDHSMRVMTEESFGPVVGIMRVASDMEAIELMNDSDFGLTASLWTQDTDRARRIASQVETGTVFMNRADYLDPALCWTGCKQTGKGGSLSEIGYHNLTRPKSLHFKKLER